MKFSCSLLLSALMTVVGISPCSADTGTTVQAGMTYISPRADFSPISGPFVPSNTLGLAAETRYTLFLGATQDLGTHLQVDLLGGIPPKHDVKLQILQPANVPPSARAFNGAVIAQVTQLAPTLLLNYRFGTMQQRCRPFIGLGANFTDFIKTQSTAVGNAVNGGATNINLKHSWGPAAQAGINYALDQHWSVTASVLTVRVRSTLTSNTLGVENTANVMFRPVVATLALGYRF